MKTRFGMTLLMFGLMAVVTGASFAAPVWDNGGPTTDMGYGYLTRFASADDFVLSSGTTLGTARFWTLEDSARAPFTGTWLWEIRENTGLNTPGTVIAGNGVAPISRSATGVMSGDFVEYVNVIDLESTALTAGTYWLALRDNNSYGSGDGNDDALIWSDSVSTTNLGAGHFLRLRTSPSWAGPFGSDRAFELFAVPEPSSFALAAMSVAGLAAFARRRKK